MAMVQGDPVPLLVSLKAVDPAEYPFYGTVTLSPAGDLRSTLTDSTVVVDDNLLVRLRAKVGDQLKIGGRWFRIAAVIAKEPDRMTAGVGLGPRVMMTRQAMEETELLQPGSRATERYLFALGDKLKVADVRAQIEKILPDAQVTDFRETSPTLTQGVDRATGLLSLICLVAMVLGAIGVAMAMRAHLQQRIEILAIMKSIGARSSDILRIYLIQTLFLGVFGALIGVVLGLGVEYAFPTVLGRLLPLRPEIRLPLGPVLAALGTGILTTLLFCLPPLLDVRNVRPSLVLRRMVESGDGDRMVHGVLCAVAEGAQIRFCRPVNENCGEAKAATGIGGGDLGGVGRHCGGACRFDAGGEVVCGVFGGAAGVHPGAFGGDAANAARDSVTDTVTFAFGAAAWAGKFVSAGESVRGGVGGAGHGCDADPERVSDAAVDRECAA
jgi:predicted lysophospholipase L1 biosynthesis ABC-type transport system permease subunit